MLNLFMGLHVMQCVVLLIFGNKSKKTCTELEVLEMTPSQKKITVNENSLFNLTVRLRKSYCPEKWNWSLVKLSTYDNDKQFDVCKIIVSSGTCQLSGWSQCVCLQDGFVQFSKWVTQEDSQIFIWKWSDSHSLSTDKIREITLFVKRSVLIERGKATGRYFGLDLFDICCRMMNIVHRIYWCDLA
ncbi:uncharacterized protein LOC112569461 [Pomacea canaliculata]|uniref:uncharacterized protein LOC112569461 n=1 Tax=Pomacea canaliculata TaxID=400727 RepID=UPI000D73B7AD|nr:uncharacterized protein LOC112569461 [Pomacea canaliculata]